jgi:hypothetical protein
MTHSVPAAVLYLRSVYDSSRQLFPVTTTLADGRYESGFEPHADALRYTITCLLGLHAATGAERTRAYAFAERYAATVARPSDAGLLLVLLSHTGDPGAWSGRLVKRSRHTLATSRPRALNAQDLAWMLWGAVAAARHGVTDAEPLAHALFAELSGRADHVTGLPSHVPVRWRERLVSFGAVTYFLRAMHEYWCLTGDPTARDLFARGLLTTLRAQDPDGGWPWLLDIHTGGVLERYPVYTVHQLSMSALFLRPALAEGVLDETRALDLSVEWADGANELGLPMVCEQPPFMARAIERRDRWQRPQRYLRATAASLTGRRARRAPERTLRVNRVSHSYEWGWLLLAGAEWRPTKRREPVH